MKKYLVILPVLFLSCNAVINSTLKSMGVYDDVIHLQKINYKEKEIVFFPMHHIGTEKFYNNVLKKIDSLKKDNFYFYLEMVTTDKKKDTILRKFRKISGRPFSKNGQIGDTKSILSKKLNLNVKFNKKIINQPSYLKLGLDSLNSKNVDVSLTQIIYYYEKKYNIIQLEACDFETTIFEYTTCKQKKMSREQKKDIFIDFRNKNIVKAISKDQHKKIAIIYGKNHIEGLLELLDN